MFICHMLGHMLVGPPKEEGTRIGTRRKGEVYHGDRGKDVEDIQEIRRGQDKEDDECVGDERDIWEVPHVTE